MLNMFGKGKMMNRLVKTMFSIAVIGTLIFASQTYKAEELQEPQDTYLSDDIIAICERAQDMYNISAPLLEALIETESSGRQYAKTDTSVGLCQLNVKYQYALATEVIGGGVVDMYDPQTNIFTACAYINILRNELDADGEPMQVLKAYNEGPEHARLTYWNVIDYGEYANKVITRADEITRAQEAK